ncbi:hypothetical protein QBC36DRAFT_316572 [Triangularia setosa]|uniref:Retroviral polymerase SH3-like domain-containing protein n=1 Tax=Triangularia setosa TaxID=2587417 RepID=A0AAN7A0B1_9PEZI|nr:hypothetical protein QBC36DRAFT_316572 [Podospora setosa]
MIDLKIPMHLWPFVVDSVVRVINLLPSKATPNGTSPHEAFFKAVNMPGEAAKPYIKHLRTYFCDAFYYIKPAHRDQGDKFSARARKGKLIGYGDLHGRIYWVWDPELHKIVRVNAVKFNETEGSETPYPESEEHLYEAVFVDSTVAETEKTVKIARVRLPGRPDVQIPPPTTDQPEIQTTSSYNKSPEQDSQQAKDLPSPRPSMPENTPDSQLIGENQQAESDNEFYEAEIASEAPIPPNNRQYPLSPTASGLGSILLNDTITVDALTSQVRNLHL